MEKRQWAMENFLSEYSKFLDETNHHLSLQTIATYINLYDSLSDKEKLFISNHLEACRECTESFNLIFDEDLELDGMKNVISLFRQLEDKEHEAVTFRSADSLVEVEITRLSKNDINLRFISLPSRLKQERAALKVNTKYILRVLAMDMETVFIIHSEEDIMNLDSFELVSLTAPPVIPEISKPAESVKVNKNFRYTVAVIIIALAVAVIYFTLKSGSSLQNQTVTTQTETGPTSRESQVGKSNTNPLNQTEPAEQNVAEKKRQPGNVSDVFSPNADLENHMKIINSGNARLKIISPAVGTDVRMPVTFEWIPWGKNITLKFEILSNRNSPVYNSLINGRELTIDTKLDPGLYYWKLDSSDSTEAIGKFFIR